MGHLTRILGRSKLFSPAVFGIVDGLTAAVGVVLSLTGHPELVVSSALSVALAEMVGMAAGEWLSDSDNGFGGAAAIGVAVFVGSIAPALPWLWLRGAPAMGASLGVLCFFAAITTRLRADRGMWRAAAETYGVLGVTLLAVYLAQFL